MQVESVTCWSCMSMHGGRSHDLFIINLKMKLHLKSYAAPNHPSYMCGKVIDKHGVHTFSCRRVSKKSAQDQMQDPTGKWHYRRTLHDYQWTKWLTLELPRVCPMVVSLRPMPSLTRSVAAANPCTCTVTDFTVTHPKNYQNRPQNVKMQLHTTNRPQSQSTFSRQIEEMVSVGWSQWSQPLQLAGRQWSNW